MFVGSYMDWNQKKIKGIVDYYGHQFFLQKRILDLGSGHGDIGGVFHRLGADVTAVDARQEHLKIISKKYAGVKTIRADLDQPWPFFGKKFDLILDLGLVCHLNKLEEHLKAVCLSTSYLILETAVLDSSDPNACIVKPDNKNLYDGSFNGFNSQSSAANIERILKSYGMNFKRMDNAKFNSGSYIYDWQPSFNNGYDNNKRRIWFCVNELSESQIDNKTSTSILVPNNAGIFSPHLTDSKIPITHQHLMTSKSPAPPNRLLPTTIPQKPSTFGVYANQGNSKIRVFFNYYIDKNPIRQQEIDACLQKNLDNALIDLIIVESEDNPTFDFLFKKINQLANDDDISIICNSDIFFDQTIKIANRIKPGEIYALTSWDISKNNTSALSKNVGQDAWIVRGKVINVNGNFPIGKPSSDFRIAYEFHAAGYTILNPGKSIKAYHNHLSGIKNSTQQDRILGQYLIIDSVTT